MKKSGFIFSALVCVSNVAAQTILPDETTVIDTEKRERCQQIIYEVDAMSLECDTVSFYARSFHGDTLFTRDGALTYNLEELYFDENKRLRKYFSESFVRDGENSQMKIDAWYDEKGNLIYITYDGDSHCDAISGHLYIYDGRIIDFMSEYDCGCCDEKLTEVEINNTRPAVGSDASMETIGWGASLTNFIHADTLFSILKSKEYNRYNEY